MTLQKITKGPGVGYPHRFWNANDIRMRPICNDADLYEFPLSHTVAYQGGDPGKTRGIFTFKDAEEGDI